ncbi:MAG TPA: YggT family protein [Microthrixaceae bacterium]|jgi:YggT family protein|nr:YggT family protein [Microthrixaceae bacterium]
MIILYWILTALLVLLVLRAVLSWFPPGGQFLEQVNSFLFTCTEWLLAPVRRVVPPLRLGGAMLDMSFMVVMLVIIVLQGLVSGAR